MGLDLAVNFRRVDPSKGGAETYVADLCRALIAGGHRVDLYAEEWAEGVLPAGVGCVRVPSSGRTTSARIRSFAEHSEAALRGRSYDCTVGFINTWATDVLVPQGGVHGASLEANARRFPEGWRRRLYLAAKRANPKAGLYREIEARQYDPQRGARLVVAVSRMVRGHLERFHGVPADRVRVIPNAIDAGRLAVADPEETRRRCRRENGLSDDDLVALFVGHNFRLKGLGPLLKALRLRLDRDPSARPVHLLVCGGGRLAPFAREVRRLRLERSVRLIGFAPDVRAVFHASDFFVLPSYYDPCSLVVFEALACGLPVITTECNGAGEVIAPGREGFIVPAPDDLTALADAMDRMTDDAARRAMSRAAVGLGREQSFERHVARLVGVFQEIALGGHRSAA
jgi:UDP-glucose:(heptosyl)LPS alpha-1,3-glucosyltransferase